MPAATIRDRARRRVTPASVADVFQLHDEDDERTTGATTTTIAAVTSDDAPALRLSGIRFVRGDTTILDGVDLNVQPGERWLLLGTNGCGKTSLLRIAALYEHPTAGTVEVLGERLGYTDVRVLRRRIGFVSAALSDQFRPTLSAFDAVRTARYGALEPWWHRYSARRRAALATASSAWASDDSPTTRW